MILTLKNNSKLNFLLILSLFLIGCNIDKPKNQTTNTEILNDECTCILPEVGGNIKTNEVTHQEKGIGASPEISISTEVKKIIDAKIGGTGSYNNKTTTIKEVYKEVIDHNPNLNGELNIYRNISCAYYILVCSDKNITEIERIDRLKEIIDEYKTTAYTIYGREQILEQENPEPRTSSNSQQSSTSIPNSRETAYPKVVRIGNQLWTSRNLNIPISGSIQYHILEIPSNNHGRLYTLGQALSACRKLGKGWRLPTDEDWNKLFIEVYNRYQNKTDIKKALSINLFSKIKQLSNSIDDMSNLMDEKYKAQVREGFVKLSEGGESGFDALMGGYSNGNQIFDFNKTGYYWSNSTYALTFFDSVSGLIDFGIIQEDMQYASCKCVK